MAKLGLVGWLETLKDEKPKQYFPRVIVTDNYHLLLQGPHELEQYQKFDCITKKMQARPTQTNRNMTKNEEDKKLRFHCI